MSEGYRHHQLCSKAGLPLSPEWHPLKECEHDFIVVETFRVTHCRLEKFDGKLFEYLDGIMDALLPCLAVQHFEAHPRRGMPVPPEVIGQFAQTRYLVRNISRLRAGVSLRAAI